MWLLAETSLGHYCTAESQRGLIKIPYPSQILVSSRNLRQQSGSNAQLMRLSVRSSSACQNAQTSHLNMVRSHDLALWGIVEGLCEWRCWGVVCDSDDMFDSAPAGVCRREIARAEFSRAARRLHADGPQLSRMDGRDGNAAARYSDDGTTAYGAISASSTPTSNQPSL